MEGGNNLEQATALVAAANKVVQDPNSVGSALRTISLRLRGTSVEILEEMGEETDGVVESTSKLQEKLKALTGVDIVDMNGAYKDTYTILKEIGAVWEEMDPMDQAAALELMAGKNRANTLAAILNNMEDLEGAYESALKAEGSALRENETYLDSIQGRIDLFNNALQTMWMNLVDSSMIKSVVDGGTFLIKQLDTLHGRIIAIASALTIYKKIKDKTTFAQMFDGAVKSTQNVYSSIIKIVTATKTATKADVARALASKGVEKGLVRRIVAEAGLKGVTSALTKEQIKLTATTLSEAFANGTLTTSQYLAAMSTMGLKTALQGLWIVLKANPVIAITAAVTTAALAFDHFHTTAQEGADAAKEAFNEIQNIVDTTKSTIQELESELTTLQDKIDELNGKEVSFANNEELEKLQKQREELEHSLKVQEQLLKLQQDASNKQAVASMKAYTKAASEGADETQETAKTWGTIGGVVAGIAAAAGIIAAIPTGGLSLGATVASVGAAGAAGGLAGNKIGEAAGSKIAENDGTYDSWYETYTKAIETAREEEQKALEEYQKDSSNIDKLDKWQEAQQKASDIEVEMYEHLSQMQQYYSSLEYGVSDEIDKELDTWHNFLDKLSINQGASGAEVTALDRIFGENASEEIQSIKQQILDAVKSGKEFDFNSAINGSQELSDTLAYVGLTAEDVKNYFTQIGEVANNASANEIIPVKSYSALTEEVTAYNDILNQTEEIITNNTEVSKEYKDALKELGVSEQDLSECFYENNPLVIKNADALNALVKDAKKATSQNIKLAKSQARLDYYEKYKELKQLTNGQKITNAATLSQVKALYQEMTALQKTITRYSMLEHQLLGATNAYEEFAKAQEIDSENDYESKAEELVSHLVDAFHTAKLGSESAQAAIKGLVPKSVYEDLDTLDQKMDAVYKYFTEDLSDYFYVKFNDDGSLESAEMLIDNVKKFVENGIGNGVFTGSWEEWDLDPTINSLDELAKKMGVTKEVAYAFLQAMETYDISWIGGDASTLLDKLLPSTAEIKALGDQMQQEFDQTPIDLTARVRVSAETMQAAGWDVEDGSYSTVNTVTYAASDFGLSDENGNDYAINVTPILPDGTVIDGGEDGLWEYINGKIKGGESLENLDIFLGSYKTIEEAETAAKRLHELQEDYYNMVKSYSLENEIYANTQKQAELQYKIGTGEITADTVVGADGKTTAGEQLSQLNKDAEANAQAARENAAAWTEANEAYESAKEAVSDLNSKLKDAENTGNDGHIAKIQGELKKAEDTLWDTYAAVVKCGEPTEVTLTVAIEQVQKDLANLKESMTKDELNIASKVDITNLEKGQDGKWIVNIEGYSKLDEASKAKVQQYISYLAEEHNINILQGEGAVTTLDVLTEIKDILHQTYTLMVETTDAENKAKSFSDIWNSIKDKTVTLVQDVKSFFTSTPNESDVNGTAHVTGTAHANGSWGAPRTETALTGELGPEILVRNGRWTTVGENGAEFTHVKKGDIIFNHKQSEQLLKNGHITGRGKAYIGGTAYAGEVHPYTGGMNISRDWDNITPSLWDAATNGEHLSDSLSDASDAASEFAETFDWIEVRLEEINEYLDLMNAKLENAVGYSSKNSIIDSMIGTNETKMSNLVAGIQEYAEYAAKLLAEVPSQYRAAAQDGAIAITEFAGEADEATVEAINNYREWAQKVADLRQQLEEVKTEITDLAKQKFDNISDEYDGIVGLIENQNEKLEAQVDLMEDRGYVAATQYYESMMVNTEKIQGELEKEKKALQAVLDQQVKAGNIDVGSEEWYEMVDALYEVDAAIVECTSDLESYQNAINDIHWDNFDNLITYLDYLKGETQDLIDLMDNDDMHITPEGKTYEGGTVKFWTADDVEWTKEGIASMGLYAQQLEIAEYEARQYAEQIDELNKQYADGRYSETEYLEKLEELTSAQYDSIEAYYEAQDAIVELNEARVDSIKEGIEKEIEAYEELIDKKKEELDAEKDLYDFQKSTMEQQKNIADIQRKLAALSADNSASAIAKRRQLEAELAEANAELEESYYDRSVENQQTALDKELEDFQAEKDAELEKWEEYLTNVELVVAESLGLVQANALGVYDTLSAKAEEYDLTLSDAIMTPWQDGALAVSDYQTVFDTAMSSTWDQLEAIRLKWQEIIDKMAEAAGQEIASQKKENSSYTAATKAPTPAPTTTNTNKTTTTPAEKAITVGGKVNAGSAKIYASVGGQGYNQYYSKDPVYTVLATQGDWIKVRHHSLKSGVTGWFKKGSVKAYAKGSMGIPEDQWAWIDELGEELQLIPGKNGRLEYVKKGTGIVPADLTERLMDLAMNPQEILDRNRPEIAPSKSIVNNNMEIAVDASVGTLMHIEHLDGNNPDEVIKIVDKAWDKKIQGLNSAIKKFTR